MLLLMFADTAVVIVLFVLLANLPGEHEKRHVIPLSPPGSPQKLAREHTAMA